MTEYVTPAAKEGELLDLGRRDYEATLGLMRERVSARQANTCPDALLLVEHPEVITLGRRKGSRDNVLHTEIPVVEVERGGDVTYHGPGQLVGYPILFLDESERDLHRLLRALEQAIIDVCALLGLAADRKPGLTGVWVGEKKIASLGIAVRRWVTLHGFALNVATDLARFGAIHPCGLDASVMTSLERSLGRAVTLDEVKPLIASSLGKQLGRNFK